MPAGETASKHIGSFKSSQKTSNAPGKNYLLVIAINRYKYCPRLSNAVKDARDLIEVLTQRYKFEPENVLTLFDEQATEAGILKVFREITDRVTSDDNLIIFFSGHGEYDSVFREGYWVPVNAKPGAIQDYVPNGKIRTVLNVIRARHIFLIVDSCFSGSLFMQYKSTRIAERLEKDPSRWGLTAGRNEIVADGMAGENSPFAESLIYHLKHSEGAVGVSELCNKVVEDVIASANQTPRGEPLKVKGHRGGQFFFHLKGENPGMGQSEASRKIPVETKNEDHLYPSAPKPKRKKWLGVVSIAFISLLLLGLFLRKKSSPPSPDSPVISESIKPKQEPAPPTNGSTEKVTPPPVSLNEKKTPSEMQTASRSQPKEDFWKSRVLPLLEKGERALNADPPRLGAAEKYFLEALKVAKAKKLPVEDIERKLLVVERKKKAASSTSEPAPSIVYGQIKDSRDGQVYKTLVLEGRTWLAEDLKYEVPGEPTFCYDDVPGNCKKYGRFYSWSSAQKACPAGWRLSTYEDWRRLVMKLGGPRRALPHLMEGGKTGFNLQMSGERSTKGAWANLGQAVGHWTSTEADGQRAYSVISVAFSGEAPEIYYPKKDKVQSYFLCRCVKK